MEGRVESEESLREVAGFREGRHGQCGPREKLPVGLFPVHQGPRSAAVLDRGLGSAPGTALGYVHRACVHACTLRVV